MNSSKDDDMLDAFFRGEIIKKPKPIKKETHIKEENIYNWKRNFNEISNVNNTIISEEQRILTHFLNKPVEDISLEIDIDDDVEEIIDPSLNVYEKYQFDLKPNNLPILSKREEILRAIDKSPCIILQANTGSGKTSQVKFINNLIIYHFFKNFIFL